MEARRYDPERDFDAWFRLHLEAGWTRDTERCRAAHEIFADCGRVLVSEVDGEVEGHAATHSGSIRYLDRDLPTSVVSGVITGRVARRRGLAPRLTAEAVAADAVEQGAALSVLGMFDQGYYDRLGFATGPYDIDAAIDPVDLVGLAASPPRTPVRLDAEDWERVHESRLQRRRPHGSLVVTDPGFTRQDLMQRESVFGFGFEGGPNGELTHHIFATGDSGGPWRVIWHAFRTPAEFTELMSLLATTADQVRTVRFIEPPGIQIQSLLVRPFRRQDVGAEGTHDTRPRALAWWQARIVDLPACLEATHLPGEKSVTFHLELTDPIAEYLSEETRRRWSGVGGSWTVTLGPKSQATRATRAAGPVLRTSVNTFTKLWLGVARPADLAYMAPDLDADPGLLDELQRVVRLPQPHLDWDV